MAADPDWSRPSTDGSGEARDPNPAPGHGYTSAGQPPSGHPAAGYSAPPWSEAPPQDALTPPYAAPVRYPSARSEAAPAGYPPVGHPGYAPPGYPPAGYAPPGYPPASYAPPGYPPVGYGPPGHPGGGYPTSGYPVPGLPGAALRPPGTVVAARVIAWVQFAFSAGGAVLLAIGAALLGAWNAGVDDDFGSQLLSIGTVVVALLAVLLVLAAVAFGIPAYLLRTGRRSAKGGALIALVIVEGVVGLLGLVGFIGSVHDGSGGAGFLQVVLGVGAPVAVVVLLLRPESRAWARAGSPPAG